MSDTRSLIVQVLSPAWRMPKPEEMDRAQLVAAIENIDSRLPLSAIEPEGVVADDRAASGFQFKGEQSRAVSLALRPIGAKIAPTMTPAQSGAWLAAMVLALSDLPPAVSRRAITKAVHRPMQFLNEVEKVVREYADEALVQQANARGRLKRMIAEIDRAAMPQPQLEHHEEPWTQEMIDEANKLFSAQRLSTRYRLVDGKPDLDAEATAAAARDREDTQ